MMNYEDFKNYVKEHILGELPDTYSEFEVSINKTFKNNGLKLDGLCIRGHDSIAPVIYLNGYYEQYNEGTSLESVMSDISEQYKEHVEHRGISSDIVKEISNIETARDKIFAKIVNTKNNKHLLENRPHTEFEDLSITYHIMVSRDASGIASAPITDVIANGLGVTTEELDAIAKENMAKNNPMYFVDMQDMMLDLFLSDIVDQGMSKEEAREMFAEMFPNSEARMYVLSNATKVNGAIWMTDPDALEMISEKVGGDFFILPSSVHEVIIVPNDGYSELELQDMVMSVNQGEVRPEDRLSDNVYAYDSKEHKLSLATHDRSLDKSKSQEMKMTVDEKKAVISGKIH